MLTLFICHVVIALSTAEIENTAIPVALDDNTFYLNPDDANSSFYSLNIALRLCEQVGVNYIVHRELRSCVSKVAHSIVQWRKHNGLYKRFKLAPVNISGTREVGIKGSPGVMQESIVDSFELIPHDPFMDNIECSMRNADVELERDAEWLDQEELLQQEPFNQAHKVGAIAILTQRKKLRYLERCLRYLYQFYNDQHKNDVWIFFESGDFSPSEQAELATNRPEVRFYALRPEHWMMHPSALKGQKVSGANFSMGYRNMVRFFSVHVWKIFREIGYDYVMRFDDDSVLLSPVRYDIFRFMRRHQLEYAYRAMSVTRVGLEMCEGCFWDLLQSFAVRWNITNTHQLLHICKMQDTLADLNSENCGDMPGRIVKFCILKKL